MINLKKFWTIKLKITTLFVALSLFILLLFSGFILLRTYFIIYRTIDANMKSISKNIELNFSKKSDCKKSLKIIGNNYVIRIYSKNKKLIHESSLAKKLKNFPDFFPRFGQYQFKTYEIKVNRKNFFYLNPDIRREVEFRVFCKKMKNGYILIAYPTESTEESFQNLLSIVAWGIGIFLFIITLIGFYFSYNTLKPIKEIIEKANYISEKSLDTRLEIYSNDEIGKLSETLNELFERLEKSFKKQKEFTANVSHELKTPLSMIKLSLENILKNSELNKTTRNNVNNVISNITRMQTLVSKLLFLSQLDYMENNPQFLKNFKPVNISNIINIIVRDFKVYFDEKDINFSLIIEKNKIVTKGDEELLEKLFFNLFLNAYKFTPNNGEITVKLTTENKKTVFTIRNSGYGIHRDKLPYIFERFYKVEESRNREPGSMGLGLAICKSIAELHNMKISVKSEINKFTEFKIII